MKEIINGFAERGFLSSMTVYCIPWALGKITGAPPAIVNQLTEDSYAGISTESNSVERRADGKRDAPLNRRRCSTDEVDAVEARAVVHLTCATGKSLANRGPRRQWRTMLSMRTTHLYDRRCDESAWMRSSGS
jgi:hypothetical protein